MAWEKLHPRTGLLVVLALFLVGFFTALVLYIWRAFFARDEVCLDQYVAYLKCTFTLCLTSPTDRYAATAAVIKKLWAEPALKATFGERDRYTNLHDGASYFWDAIDRIYKSDYIPTEEDVLRTRIRTSGFEEAKFTYKKRIFRVVDLGGQRSERRRWLEALQIATAVIFVSSLTEFDQRLREDGDSSRFAETKMLFTELLENSIQEKFIIVLLNKLDLFKTKIAGPAKQRFSEFFTDYKGPLQWEPCVEHIQDQFRHLAGKHKCRSVSVHSIVAMPRAATRSSCVKVSARPSSCAWMIRICLNIVAGAIVSGRISATGRLVLRTLAAFSLSN